MPISRINTGPTSSANKAQATNVATQKKPLPAAMSPTSPAKTSVDRHSDKVDSKKAAPQDTSTQKMFQSKETVAALNSRRGSLWKSPSSPTSSRPSSPDAHSATLAKLSQGVHLENVEGAPREFIQAKCNDIKADIPSAEILHYIDQGGDPRLADNQDARDGICSAMTSEWIRQGASHPNMNEASQAFAHTLANDFGSLAAKQVAEMAKGNEIKQLNNANMENIQGVQGKIATAKSMGTLAADMDHRLREDGAKRMEHTAANVDAHIKGPLKMKEGVDTLPHGQSAGLRHQSQTLKQGRADINARLNHDVAHIQQNQDHIQTQTEAFRTQRGGGIPGTVVHPDTDIDPENFRATLSQSTQQDGFYRLGIKKSDVSGEGHVIGLHKTGGECRLMDANTGEWKVANHEDLNKLIIGHLNEVYIDEGYDKFNLTRHQP
ncbi:hypothetical protein DRW03_25315 [Corallococcus sp. H22C18031201]|uniref:hypothetical protein n=1 Tax=Citreicoccus inhibens TaxID=2849499 RepID=UPI000E70824D|nr:hypothetical protein [Citreicoccus inhibens]MBU8898981.1 hypothetical protein [Citreicoccus inhibens]RJS18443.1 hypothetical protein DRW03_25315 [Corallococcus sp. H22C18031201]